MLDPETRRMCREMGVPGLLEALDMVCEDPSYAALAFEDKVKVVIDYAHQEMSNKRVASLLRSAHLRMPQADISNIDYEGRPLSRELVLSLGTSQFVDTATDILLQGFSGTGKSHLACALGKQACKNGYRTLYVRTPDMLEYRAERIEAGWSEGKVIGRFAPYKVLILDEFLIDVPSTEEIHFLLELTERRYDCSSTIYCSQHGTDEWHRRLGGGAHAEAILDRIVHNCMRIEMGSVNMRERISKTRGASEDTARE